ncbi:MAG: nucleoside-diphosphate kinase [Lactobacillaceae bacterium]|jgi:nucleoside-diphosphate kinase|nr:nucleoside-diphosphate kinase [Lactobacillaceae bacterium]
MTERTLVIIKPDGVQQKKVGEIIRRIERKAYDLIALRMVTPNETLLREHYSDLVDKPFFPGLLRYMMESPVVVMVVEGDNVIKGWRTLMGSTNPSEAAPGTIRGDFARDWPGDEVRNVSHGSDSVEHAQREIKIWFPDLEI